VFGMGLIQTYDINYNDAFDNSRRRPSKQTTPIYICPGAYSDGGRYYFFRGPKNVQQGGSMRYALDALTEILVSMSDTRGN
jgi:hypothetical protein